VSRRRERFSEVLEEARARRDVALMGICNVTPDSFSDGGRFFSLEDAKARVRELLAEGADFIDIGGESTRPGAVAVPAAEQLARVLGVVRFAVEAGACVSIDTASAEVAAACLDAGACVLNDVSCLRDETLASACASHGAAMILMHSREPMSEQKGFSAYPDEAYGGDVIGAVVAEWIRAARRAMEKGVPPEALVMDPGLGFSKNARQSLEILSELSEVMNLIDSPVCVGASRKSFLTAVDRGAKPSERVGASISAALWAYRQGAAILRVHDVRATAQAIDVERALGAVAGPTLDGAGEA
jgi:dihydropteroate synthase